MIFFLNFRKNIKEISRVFMDRPISAKDTAIYFVEYAAKYGNRLKSPGRKLAWYQYYLLDVYGLVLAGILIVLFIVKQIISLVYGCICSRKPQKKNLKAKKNK